MADNILSLHNVSYKYPSGVLALNNVNVALPKGKRIALLGSNGAGKSTLMFLLNGILRPTDGFVTFENEKISYKKNALRTLRSKVGFIFQDSDNQLLAPTVYEEISFGLNNLRKDKERVRKKVEEAIDAFCLHEFIERSPHELSSGQKKRVCLASILAMEPELMVCDEPTSNLDPWHAKLTMNYLNNLNSEGKTILIATHDVNMAYEWAEYIIVLKHGEIKCIGNPKDVFRDQQMVEDARLSLPYVVETYMALLPDIRLDDLPRNAAELKKLLKQCLCTDS